MVVDNTTEMLGNGMCDDCFLGHVGVIEYIRRQIRLRGVYT